LRASHLAKSNLGAYNGRFKWWQFGDGRLAGKTNTALVLEMCKNESVRRAEQRDLSTFRKQRPSLNQTSNCPWSSTDQREMEIGVNY
jgi:hypothetical protein